MSHVPNVPDAKPHLAAIIQWSDDAIISKDLQGIITSWNKTAERMFGYTEAEAVGRSITIIIPPERLAEEGHVLSHVASGRTVEHFETVRVDKAGRRLDISLTVSPIKDADGKIIGASKIARDITERKRSEQAYLQLLQERGQLQRDAARMKDEFLAMLSHELRTPLNAIMGWTDLLMTGTLSAVQSQQAFATIRRSVQAQTTILGDLLDLSRITQGMLRLELTPVNLATTVQDAFEVVRLAASAGQITVEVHRDLRAYIVLGDALRLQQVVWNILSNAIKFTPRGGRIDIHLELESERIRLSVEDTGEGIAEEFIPHVFSRFRQADSSRTRAHGGLGLGLALVREIVELHSGTVTVASPGIGRGTTVSVELPENRPAAGLAAPLPRDRTAMTSLGGLRILVTDDEQADRELLRVMLEQAGAEIQTAGSAAEALRQVQDWRPHLLISDLAMPKEGGFALISRVRALEDPTLRHIPAIAVTAHVSSEDRVQALQAGFGHYLSKPIDRDVLVELAAAVRGQV